MFKTIKGHIRRLRTAKKDSTYQVDIPVYGEFECSYIHSCIIDDNNNWSNIILRLDYDNTKEYMINDVNKLLVLLNICGIKYIPVNINSSITLLYIAGSIYSYTKLIHLYYYNPKYRYNKLFCLIRNMLNKIDITKDIDEYKDDRVVYSSESVDLRQYEVYTQNVSSMVDSEIIDEIYPLLLTVLCKDIGENYSYYAIDFLYMYYYDDMNNELSTVIYNNRASSFIIGGKKYKSILDITLKVNNQDSSGYNEDIDEILD